LGRLREVGLAIGIGESQEKRPKRKEFTRKAPSSLRYEIPLARTPFPLPLPPVSWFGEKLAH